MITGRATSCLLALGLALGCGHGQDPAGPRNFRQLILAYDDNHPTASMTFPNLTYESVVRFELPAGKHHPLDLHLMVGAVGTIAITFYEDGPLESPGDEIHVITRELLPEDVSNGMDGRWILADLRELPALKGVVWIGMRKVGGTPSVWTSPAVSGQTYLRDRDPARAMGLLPVKRTPMLRLGVLP